MSKIIKNKSEYKCVVCASTELKWFNYKRQLCNKCACKMRHRLYNIDSKKSEYKRRFGGLRDQILERDNYKCKICGMTNDEHIKEFGRSITINHIDGNGRYSKSPNNKTSNLETLCLRCHGRIDSLKYWHEGSVLLN